MSEGIDDDGVLDTLLNNFKHLPAGSSTESFVHPRKRIFDRHRPIHEVLGGSRAADVLLWRRKNISASVLTAATMIWILFEWAECYFVSVVSLIVLCSLISLFAWSNIAAFLHRPPPPVPRVELSDDLVLKAATVLKVEVNKTLRVLYDIAMGQDFKLFIKVVVCLWIFFVVGGWFHFLTLLYIGVVAAHTLPFTYEKYEDLIEKNAEKVLDELQNQYKKLDAKVLSKIPRGPTKEKKSN